MSVFTDYRESRDLAGRRAFRVGRGCGGALLTCLLALAGWCGTESAAIAAGGTARGAAGDSSGLQYAVDWLLGQSDAQAAPERDRLTFTTRAAESGSSQRLETEVETAGTTKRSPTNRVIHRPILRKNSRSSSLRRSPSSRRANSAGMQVHPAMVPLFRSMVLHYTGGTY